MTEKYFHHVETEIQQEKNPASISMEQRTGAWNYKYRESPTTTKTIYRDIETLLIRVKQGKE